MRPRSYGRFGLIFVLAAMLLAISACRSRQPEPGQSPKGASPADDLTAYFRGLGYMEQYEYRKAVEAFREVHRRSPGWSPGAINLAIALLNDSGVEAEKAKKAGGGPAPDNFDEALSLLSGVLDREPDNPYAHFCRGIILEQQGRIAAAHQHFKRVTEIDPTDATAWYWMASTLPNRGDPNQPAGPAEAKEQIDLFRKALDLDPYLVPAIYKMAMAERFNRGLKVTNELLDQFKKLNPDRPERSPGPGDTSEKRYGDMGKYATVINPFQGKERAVEAAEVPPNFEAARPLQVKLADGERWVKPSDFSGPLAVVGRARARFGTAITVFDADGDGRDDVFLTSAVLGPKGVHDVLLLNQGEGRFEEASARFGFAGDRASIGAAAADFDADRQIDLFLTGAGGDRLLRNIDGKRFEDISSTLKSSGPPAVSLMARWLDLDQDGDLDLYVVNYCAADHADRAFVDSAGPPPGVANRVYRNDGLPAEIPSSPMPAWAPLAVADGVKAKSGLSVDLKPWTEAEALEGGESPHTGVASLDIDNDRDVDLVLSADGKPTIAILNDRLGQFHAGAIKGMSPAEPGSGLLVTDLDADGRMDLVAPSAAGRVLAWRNATVRTIAANTELAFEPWPINATRWRAAQAVDLDLDGRPDLLGTPGVPNRSGEVMLASWARNQGQRYTAKTLPLRLETPGIVGLAAVDLVGDPLPDILVIPPGEPPTLSRNLGNGQHWLALQLGGHWHVKPELMRTNSHAFGTRVILEGQGIYTAYDHTTPESGTGQSITPIILGLGNRPRTDLVHILWPDGVMQCELNVSGDQKLKLTEKNRKTGSCPVLFTWNGRQFVCLGDFLGGGGLGYLVAPGVYGQPDRDEAVAITAEQLRPTDGVFRISITEPMDEVAYLDHVKLEVVDRPPGVSSTPDERFAPEGPRPTGELLAWRSVIDPVRATDLEGRDMTETLRHWDRRTVDTFLKRDGWIGYTTEHGVVLDFGDRLSRYGPGDRLVLCLAGWVEYPYSQTNYAAATAGVMLKPPAIERRRDDGSWETIEPHAGYPAGLPRLMTRDLTGKLGGPRCVLRIKTNMECYYDQAMIVVRDPAAEASLRVTTLPVAGASLGYRGYTREVSPDGRQPLIYDYDYVDPAPLARFSGKLTRYGEVSGLLREDDDRLCLVGPGDEVRIEFEARRLPALPEGWTRSYVLRTYGYCKDADPFTAMSDTIGPLPWRGMPAFPFAREIRRPGDPAYESYLREYQTRPAGGGE